MGNKFGMKCTKCYKLLSECSYCKANGTMEWGVAA